MTPTVGQARPCLLAVADDVLGSFIGRFHSLLIAVNLQIESTDNEFSINNKSKYI